MTSIRQFVLALIVALAAVSPAHAAGNVYPGTNWQTATPASVGMDGALLQAALSSLNGNVMVVRNGYLVGQKNNIAQEKLLYSVSKSLTALVFGTLLQAGQVAYDDQVPYSGNPSTPLASYRQFLNMTSDYGLTPHSPGNYYAYNNKAVHHYGWAMQPYFGGSDPDVILNQALFNITGRQDPIDFRGLWSGWGGGFTLSARDCARLGYLVLREGVWQGQQVVPESFVSALYANQVPAGAAPNWSVGAPPIEGVDGNNWWNQYHLTSLLAGNYSFGWWTNQNGLQPLLPADTIWASGLGGHLIVVCRSLDLLVCVTSGGDSQTLSMVMPPILAAVMPASRDQGASSWGPGEVAGELRTWHKVSVTFDGPVTNESATVNPYRDYRLDVTFSNGGESFVVPGHYAADGNAAESGASSGAKWRVHFTPHLPGVWTYQASFRTGHDVALDASPAAGTPSHFHGTRGSFMVEPSDKTGRDFRGKGMLHYTGERYLSFAGNGEFFLKGGADSPENFLAYSGFDQTPNSHYYAPHVGDWRPGDLDWKNGFGRPIIGALNYLSSMGMNSVYFLTMNVNGDGNDVWPWTSMSIHDRYDCSKLDQWEIVFEHMDRCGIMLHMVTQETENDHLLNAGALGLERKLYYRELVSRFSHHPALIWNLGEENTNTDLERKQFADHLRALDPYDHPIAVHTEVDAQQSVYGPLLGYPTIEAASLQLAQVDETHDETLTWVNASAAAGRPWVVCLDEIGPSSLGVVPDSIDPEHDEVRREGLWGNLMAGGAGVEWYFGYLYSDHDLTCENWRSRHSMWQLTGLALDFFQTYLPFDEMVPADQLVSISNASCLARAGDLLAVYLPTGGSPGIDLSYFPGIYSVEWLDPRNGGALQVTGTRFVSGGGWTSVGSPPSSPLDDWVLLLQSVDLSQQVYGSGLPGYNGLTPHVLANSSFVGNPTFRVYLSSARPYASSMLVVGSQPASAPVFGGLLLNNAAYGYVPVGVDPTGKTYFGIPIPDSAGLAGRDLYFQWFVSDASAGGGVAMSRGLRVTLFDR